MPSFSAYREQRPFYIEDVYSSSREIGAAIFSGYGLTEGIAHEAGKWWIQNVDKGPDNFALTEDEIKSRVGDLNVEASEGITSKHLDILIADKKKEMARQRVMMRSDSSIASGLVTLTAGLAASLLDPIEIGASLVPVVGQAKYLRMLESAGTVMGRAGVRAGVGAAGGVVGTAAIEPLSYVLAKARQEDYELSDSLMNIVFGGLLGGGLHTAGGALKDLYYRAPKDSPVATVIDNLSPETRENALRTAANQYGAGKVLNIESILRTDPRYSYTLGRSIQEPPPGVGGGRKSITSEVDAAVKTRLVEAQSQIDAKYEGKILPRGEVKEIKSEIGKLRVLIEKNQSIVESRGKGDVVRTGAEANLVKHKKNLKKAETRLKSHIAAKAERDAEYSQVTEAMERLDKSDDFVDMPPFLRRIVDEELAVVSKNIAPTKLQRVMSDMRKQDTYDAYSIFAPSDRLVEIKADVEKRARFSDDDLVDEILKDAQKQVDEFIDDPDIVRQMDDIRTELEEMKVEESDLQSAMKEWLKCRRTNG